MRSRHLRAMLHVAIDNAARAGEAIFREAIFRQVRTRTRARAKGRRRSSPTRFSTARSKGIILDAFAGSGTTLVAAERTGRRGYGIELDPRYCDAIIRRLAKVAGLEATHADTGRTFAEIEAERAAEASPGLSDANTPLAAAEEVA